MKTEVRVRFAPSPTGSLHIGGLRTALYNYLFARRHSGKFIVRIEDTDQNRFVEGAEDYIYQSLAWLGIEIDEGGPVGGPHAPYRQSERKAMYRQYADQLIEAGHAYYAFDTAEELNVMRERLKAAQVPDPKYNSISRATMKNSLTLPESEWKALLEAGTPYVIRLKVPRKEEIRIHDLIRGWVLVHSNTLDDKVLMKSDGMPTYHLANVVDDYLMKISHVIRGEEWLPSAPTHVLLYKYLGWEAQMPEFAHLPLLLKPDGMGKLSKRDGLLHGFPVFPLAWTQTDPESGQQTVLPGFREEGYLPDAMLNFLALLGWNPGTPQELFSKQELVDVFGLERISKAGAKFDINKAKWFNQQYLRQIPTSVLAIDLMEKAKAAGFDIDQNQAAQAVELVRERAVFVADLWQEAVWLYQAPNSYDEKVRTSRWNEQAAQILAEFAAQISTQNSLEADQAKQILTQIIESKSLKPNQFMQATRLALTGRGAGPDLMQVIALLGPKESAARIEAAIKILG